MVGDHQWWEGDKEEQGCDEFVLDRDFQELLASQAKISKKQENDMARLKHCLKVLFEQLIGLGRIAKDKNIGQKIKRNVLGD